MTTTKTIAVFFVVLFISACVGKFSQYATSENCSVVFESVERTQCFEKVSDFNDDLKRKLSKDAREKRAAEKKERDKLDFSKNKEENLDNDSDANQKQW